MLWSLPYLNIKEQIMNKHSQKRNRNNMHTCACVAFTQNLFVVPLKEHLILQAAEEGKVANFQVTKASPAKLTGNKSKISLSGIFAQAATFEQVEVLK